jgi:SAM-dependent methyltransferase
MLDEQLPPDLAGRVSLRVSPDDDMFAFSYHMMPTHELGVMAYFRAGIQIFDAVDQIARWQFGSLDAVGTVCDFACGYGRSTRVLAAASGPQQVWAAEILPKAVEFQVDAFGVHGVQSTTDPDDLDLDQHFDLIMVSSLFSHLPDRTFTRWLSRLIGLLSDRGILVFSVHDASLLQPDDPPMNDDGIVFIPTTEIADLDTADYGATFVTEDYVSAALARAGARDGFRRIQRGLCFHQDLYIASRSAELSASPLHFQFGAHGSVERVELVDRDTLAVSGWAADLDQAIEPAMVRIELGGTAIGEVRATTPRPDVAADIAPISPDQIVNGWTADLRIPTDQDLADAVLLVTARTATGREFVLHAAPLGHLTSIPDAADDSLANRVATRLEHVADLLRREGWAATGRRALEEPGRWYLSRRGADRAGPPGAPRS